MTRRQLLVLGWSSSAIAHEPVLVRVHRGVYAFGHRRLEPRALAHAAVLACGPEAVLSHSSAAALWNFEDRWPRTIEVSSPRHPRPAGITVHRCATLTAADITTHHGIPTTTPERTLLDVAPRLGERRLRRAMADGRRAGLVHLDELRDACERAPRHPGRPLVLAVIADTDPEDGPTRSALEDEFLQFVERFGLPRPLVNRRHNGREVDIRYPDQKLIIELDGWDFHRDREVFESDRERDAEALASGSRTLRITKRRLRADAEREAERLHRILAGGQLSG